MVFMRLKRGLKKGAKKVLDKTTIDDHIIKGTKKVLDKTTIDDHIVKGAHALKKEVRKHIITAITAAFGFLIALSWRDAISTWINTLVDSFSLSDGWYKFVAAVIVTIIGVFGIVLVSKLEEKPVK